MRRVYVIYTVRELTSPLSLKVITFGVCFLVVNSVVSLPQVFLNMPSVTDVSALSKFASSAFAHTDTAVKILTIAGAGLMVWAGRDVARTVSSRNAFAHSGARA